jgi:hypothetical protein
MHIKCLDSLSSTDKQLILEKLKILINLDINQSIVQATQEVARGLKPDLKIKLIEALREYCDG